MLYVPTNLRKVKHNRRYMYTDGREYDYYDMMGVEVGTFVVYNEERIVLVYGYGKLSGYAVPVGAVNPLGLEMVEDGLRCPKIKLEDGGVVWGCEVYWVERETFDSMMGHYAGAGYRLLNVNIDEHRQFIAAREAMPV